MSKAAKAWAGINCLAAMRGSVLCMWRQYLASLAVAVALPILVPAVSAQTAEQIGKVAEASIRELNLQTSLPVRDNPKGWKLNLPAIDFDLELLFWIALVTGAAIFLYQIRDELPSFVFKRTGNWREDRPDSADNTGNDGEISPSLTADELAKQGRYIEAMHWLLLGALAEIRERLGVRFPDSMTSREILRRAKIPAEGKGFLKDIITRVELSYFGDYPAGEQDFTACRTSFEHLQAVLQTQPETGAPAS